MRSKILHRFEVSEMDLKFWIDVGGFAGLGMGRTVDFFQTAGILPQSHASLYICRSSFMSFVGRLRRAVTEMPSGPGAVLVLADSRASMSSPSVKGAFSGSSPLTKTGV